MLHITTKLEIDVMQANELMPAIELAVKHSMPALVVHPSLMSQALLQRPARQGRFNIITPVDWPKGDQFGMMKMRGMTRANLSAEGFEIMLTGGKTEVENRTEMQVLGEFIRTKISTTAEVRFVLGTQVRPIDEILQMCRACVGGRAPALLRLDHHLKVQVSKGSAEAHTQVADRVKQVVQYPLKVSGNLSTPKSIVSCPWASRFGVSLAQAQAIIRELSRQPRELREILDPGSEQVSL